MKKTYRGTALDLIQAVHMENHIPLVYCYMTLSARIDADRLKQAVRRTTEIVPQILCGYDEIKNGWVPTGHDMDSVVRVSSENDWCENFVWDLYSGPQLKINIHRENDNDSLHICMSHILTDGTGFKQYLALLCIFYNENDPRSIINANRRSDIVLLHHAVVQRIRRGHNRLHEGNAPMLLPARSGRQQFHSLQVKLSPEQMEMLGEEQKKLHVTWNDVFMAVFAYVLKGYTLQDEIVIPCPADLRKYGRQNDGLTIANMTGKFLCRIFLKKNMGLKEMVMSVHKEMERLKFHHDCFNQIPLLHVLYAILPNRALRFIVRTRYSVEPVSYTNMGIIDGHKVSFQGLAIKDCYLCGTYRTAPSFQVSISTYRNTCTLSANMFGSENQKVAGMQLLKQMKDSLLYGF